MNSVLYKSKSFLSPRYIPALTRNMSTRGYGDPVDIPSTKTPTNKSAPECDGSTPDSGGSPLESDESEQHSSEFFAKQHWNTMQKYWTEDDAYPDKPKESTEPKDQNQEYLSS